MADVAASNKSEVFKRIHQWEQPENSLAPLTANQRNICLDLLEEVSSRPIPKELTQNENENNQAETAEAEVKPILDGRKIETAEELLLWCSSIEDELLQTDDVAYNSSLESLKEQQVMCSDLLSKMQTSLGHIKTLKDEYNAVSSCTNALHDACQQLLTQQTKLSETAEAIGEQLHKFKIVDTLTQQLDAPTVSIYSESFISMLDQLDQTLIYLKEHPNYKDCNTYLVRVEHCLNKATELIRSRVTTVLSTTTEQVKNLPDTATHFTRFQVVAIKLRPVMHQLEKRRHISSLYETALDSCIQSLVTERESLLNASVQEAMKELVQQSMGDYCSLMRSTCTLLIHISIDEHRMYSQFFSQPSTIFTDYMLRLCMNLLDTLRPFVIQMKYLETLAELCSILRIEMLQEHVQNQSVALEAFGNVVEQLLEDIQERLVFRAHIYFRTDIEEYRPSPGDLAYPEKLEMMVAIAQELAAQETVSLSRAESHSSLVSVGSLTSQEVARINGAKTASRPSPAGGSPADLHGMWYPPVRRTLVCLSRLYRCVEKSIFQGLSQEAINACINNVREAAKTISSNKTPIDGELFQIKHLLILREQLAPFQVDFTVKEMSLDFSKVKLAALGLLERKAKLLSWDSSNALFAFLLEGTPLMRENLLDSRKDVDKQLKTSCESFISHATNLLVGPLLSLIDSAQKYLKEPGNEKLGLSKQAFASPNVIGETVQNVLRSTKAHLPSLQKSMALYLANPDTQFILYRPIKNNVVGAFSRLSHLLLNNDYSEDDRTLIGCPSPEQISVLLSSAALIHRKISSVSDSGARRVEEWHRGRKISFENGNASTLELNKNERLSEHDESQLESVTNEIESSPNVNNNPVEISSENSSSVSQSENVLIDKKSNEQS